jgi:hypothetical protein
MLQITKNDDELLKNYPFLQAIDKLESSHASEHVADLTTGDMNCWTKHDSYSARVYSKDKIDRTYYREILIGFLLSELEKEARDTFYSNAFRCYVDRLGDLHYKNAATDRLLLEKYNDYPNSKFRRTTVMYIRDSFEEWTYQQQPSLMSISDFDKKLQGELNLYVFTIKSRFGFQKLLNKTLPEQKQIEYTVFTSTDIIPFVSSQVERV